MTAPSSKALSPKSASVPSPIEEASTAQLQASHPHVSAWVSASAGSGKTKVLTDRVLRLMLAGARPDRILCLTFTKAAAAEMSNRLSDKLSRWATCPLEILAQELTALSGVAPDDLVMRRGRQLFARMLDAPGGMKIQTLHSFCQSLLRRFPLEAGVAPHFEVTDERSARENLASAKEALLSRARLGEHFAEGATPAHQEDLDILKLAQALKKATQHLHEEGFDAVLAQLIKERGRLGQLTKGLPLYDDRGQVSENAFETIAQAIYRHLDLEPGQTADQICARACQDEICGAETLREAARLLCQSSTNDKKKGTVLAEWLSLAVTERVAQFNLLLSAFFKEKGVGEPYKDAATKTLLTKYPDLKVILEQARDWLGDLRHKINAAALAEASLALVRLGLAQGARYSQSKSSRALLDYDDLILLARALLSVEGGESWVNFKLDGGIEHVLIDEAQDTNPEQWDLVEKLTASFFVGTGALEERAVAGQKGPLGAIAPPPRSIFAVGDAKQSIYSFQRADPEGFSRMRTYFGTHIQEALGGWRNVPLRVSFRSAPPVLALVDAVFSTPDLQKGLGEPDILHSPARAQAPGVIELWPPLVPQKTEEEDSVWILPKERQDVLDPYRRLAFFLAKQIRQWLKQGLWIEDRKAPRKSGMSPPLRRLQAKDVLVLVRQRKEFVHAFVRACKALDVPVAGVDRMILTDQLAVMDVLALCRFLLLPEDDLTLATVLKGPLLGLSEEDVFALAYQRRASLWSRLQDWVKNGQASQDFVQAHNRLAVWLEKSDFLRPYEVLEDILTRDHGRARLVARLGEEAQDPLDELLALALHYEQSHPPSLQGFLHWLDEGEAETKRDLEQTERDEVRIMTVHGAKGLQAPVVILPDTLSTPRDHQTLFWAQAPGEKDTLGVVPLWSPRKAMDDTHLAALRDAQKQAQMAEYQRLLYVAMTRAEDRLYIAGYQGSQTPAAGNWYEVIQDGFARLAASDCAERLGGRFETEDLEAHLKTLFRDPSALAWSGAIQRFTTMPLSQPQEETADSPSIQPAGGGYPLPQWLFQDPAAEQIPSRPLAPSILEPDDAPLLSPLQKAEDYRFKRGLLIHKLLENLPDLPPEQWEQAGHRYLKIADPTLLPAWQEQLLAECLRLLQDPQFAPVFGPGSRAEVSITGIVQGKEAPVTVSGQIDRLCVTEDQVLVVDYKTNRPPPASHEHVPLLYRRQMALYGALLRAIYPTRGVKCALLWTDTAHLMLLPDKSLQDLF